MELKEMFTFAIQLAGTVLGTGGILTIFINAKLNAKESEAKEKKEYRLKKAELEAECRAAQGDLNLWIARGCEQYKTKECKDYWNGEVQKAYDVYKEANAKIAELDRALLVRNTE